MRGFTLIEFSLVALILGIIFALAFVRLAPQLEPDPLRADSLRLAEAIRKLRRDAVASGLPVLLRLQLPEGKWKAERPDPHGNGNRREEVPVPAGSLSEGVRLWRVRLEDGRAASEGEMTLRFLPTGETQGALLSLVGAGREERTLLVYPFLNRVEIFHGRAEKLEP